MAGETVMSDQKIVCRIGAVGLRLACVVFLSHWHRPTKGCETWGGNPQEATTSRSCFVPGATGAKKTGLSRSKKTGAFPNDVPVPAAVVGPVDFGHKTSARGSQKDR